MMLPLNGEVIVTPCVSEQEEKALIAKGWVDGPLHWEKRVDGIGKVSVATSINAKYLEDTNFAMLRKENRPA